MAHWTCEKTLYTLLKIEIISDFPSVAEGVNVTLQRPGTVFSPHMLYRPFFQVCSLSLPLRISCLLMQLYSRKHLYIT